MQPEIELFRVIHLGFRNPAFDGLALVLSWSALGWLPPLLAIAGWFHPKTRGFTAPILLTSLLGGLMFVHLIKRAMPRPRPSQLSFSRAMEPHRESSFPSGHTTLAFCTASAVALGSRRERYPKWIAPCALLWASGVGWSRIYRGVHWPSDVLAGACLGIFTGLLVEIVFCTKWFKPPLC